MLKAVFVCRVFLVKQIVFLSLELVFSGFSGRSHGWLDYLLGALVLALLGRSFWNDYLPCRVS